MTTHSEAACDLRETLIDNMNDRRGFDRGDIDEETQAEWNTTWERRIVSALDGTRLQTINDCIATLAERHLLTGAPMLAAIACLKELLTDDGKEHAND